MHGAAMTIFSQTHTSPTNEGQHTNSISEPDALGYAQRLAIALWEKHWKAHAPEWKPLPELIGVLTQIDNMTVGLRCAEWQPIETAPKDGRFMWLSNGRMMRIGYWYIVTADPSKEHWADMIRAERGGMGDLQWEPKYWMPTPISPEGSKWAPEPVAGE